MLLCCSFQGGLVSPATIVFFDDITAHPKAPHPGILKAYEQLIDMGVLIHEAGMDYGRDSAGNPCRRVPPTGFIEDCIFWGWRKARFEYT